MVVTTVYVRTHHEQMEVEVVVAVRVEVVAVVAVPMEEDLEVM